MSELMTQVLLAARGENYPGATVPHHHDSDKVGNRRPFRDEIIISHDEMSGEQVSHERVDAEIARAVANGWIRKDEQGFWNLTTVGSKYISGGTAASGLGGRIRKMLGVD